MELYEYKIYIEISEHDIIYNFVFNNFSIY
jgi:hypothetical protein